MIRYDLQCHKGHRFDAWFRDSTLADKQLRQGKMECPACGTKKVEKALMAPRLGRRSTEPATSATSGSENVAENLPGQQPTSNKSLSVLSEPETKEMLRSIRKFVETNFENVGGDFAKEARKINKGESEHRAIYGKASPQEHRALHEEGIDVTTLPWVPENDA